jgi:hypothetical protein
MADGKDPERVTRGKQVHRHHVRVWQAMRKPARRLLEPGAYKAQFDAAQTSIGRALLVLLALIAFWFAIESQYELFRSFHWSALQAATAEATVGSYKTRIVDKKNPYDVEEERVAYLKKIVDKLMKDTQLPSGSEGKEQQTSLSLNDMRVLIRICDFSRDVNLETTGRTKEQAANCLAETEERRNDLKKDYEAFKANLNKRVTSSENKLKEAVQTARSLFTGSTSLSITGTSMSVPAMFAPAVWVAAFVAWLAFILGKRRSALEASAGFVAATKERRQPLLHGSLGAGSVLLAPVPRIMTIASGPMAGTTAERSNVLAVLGWTDTDWLHRLAPWAAVIGIALLLARVCVVSFDLTGELVMQLTDRPALYGNLAYALIVATAVGVVIFLTGTILRESFASGTTGGIDESRRSMLVWGTSAVAGLTVAGWMWSSRVTLTERFQFARRVPDPLANRLVGVRVPRFLSAQVKDRRRVQRQYAVPAERADVFVFSTRWERAAAKPDDERGTDRVVIHYAGRDKQVRLFSRARPGMTLRDVDDQMLLQWARQRDNCGQPATALYDRALRSGRLAADEAVRRALVVKQPANLALESELADAEHATTRESVSRCEEGPPDQALASLGPLARRGVRVPSVLIEAAVLARLEAKNYDTAWALLAYAGGHALSPRLVHLMLGVAVRYVPEGSRSLAVAQEIIAEKHGLGPEVLALVKDGVSVHDVVANARGQYELAAWQLRAFEMLVRAQANGRWRRRWTDPKKPVVWHHPYELTDEAVHAAGAAPRVLRGAQQRAVRLEPLTA